MQKIHSTKFVKLDTQKCKACWKCLEKCSNDVLGRINLFFHKHVIIKNRADCTGCLKCTRACETLAIIAVHR